MLGWITSIFAECDNNTFGPSCTGVCGHCSEKKQCHHNNGTCLNGCDPGFSGNQCTQGDTYNEKLTHLWFHKH